MIGQCFLRGDERIIFLLIDHQRSRSRNGAPVIKNFRNVMNQRGLETLDSTQCEIPILAAFIAFAEATHRAQTRGPKSREMAGVVLAEEEIRVPVRFEVRIETSVELIDF